MENGNRRLEQHKNYNMHAQQLGVMNIFEKDGALVAQLALFDPRTMKQSKVMVGADDTFEIGGQRYRVVQLAPADGDARAWLEITPDPQLH